MKFCCEKGLVVVPGGDYDDHSSHVAHTAESRSLLRIRRRFSPRRVLSLRTRVAFVRSLLGRCMYYVSVFWVLYIPALKVCVFTINVCTCGVCLASFLNGLSCSSAQVLDLVFVSFALPPAAFGAPLTVHVVPVFP